jgi:glucose/arabinose dehydrogenase
MRLRVAKFAAACFMLRKPYPPILVVGLSGLFAQVSEAVDLTVTRVATGFSNPVYATAPVGVSDRLFVIEKNSGRIRILQLETGEIQNEPFLTVPGIELSTGGERGLLGMAFHPDYLDNGRFVLNFTGDNGQTAIREYSVSADPNKADPASGQNLLAIEQPFSNHNGGWVGFGPDGMLYIATGDGGSGNDPGNRSQDITNQLLGKILRIDLGDTKDGSYTIPSDNPFVGIEGDDEIWAYGLRNPWRCSFDRETGEFWIADVGQNYGWRVMEGNHSTGLGGGPPAFDPSLTNPIHEYSHAEGLSVTGGYVYRGQRYPEMQGLYFFADFVSGTIWSLKRESGDSVTVVNRTSEMTPDTGSIGSISSFAEDGAGELYLIDYDGDIFRIGSTGSVAGNLSTRARIGAVSDVAIAGFVLEGEGSVDLLIRGVGPGLSGFQVTDPLDDPKFEIYGNVALGGSQLLIANDDWEDAEAGSAIRAAEAITGAFSLVTGSADAAAVASFGAGSYTEVLRAGNGENGIGLVEVYRVGTSQGASSVPPLRNISTRAAVESGNGVLIAGFVLEGNGSRRFLIRGVGAGLTKFDVAGVIADPLVEIYPMGGVNPIATNDDWDGAANAAETAGAAAEVGAFPRILVDRANVGTRRSRMALRSRRGATPRRI